MSFRRKPGQVDVWNPLPPWLVDIAVGALLLFEAFILYAADTEWDWSLGAAVLPSILFLGTRTTWRYRDALFSERYNQRNERD